MAVPRKRKSRSRRGQQRSHDALTRPSFSKCPNCAAAKAPHRICAACGWYGDKTVINVAQD
ncbi:MAG: 50S ribosomal protein L32 [Deltaproteobacteria bacterium]|nr:50S ribosomal protein L32 [Deltaproteobacteria bacterium]